MATLAARVSGATGPQATGPQATFEIELNLAKALQGAVRDDRDLYVAAKLASARLSASACAPACCTATRDGAFSERAPATSGRIILAMLMPKQNSAGVDFRCVPSVLVTLSCAWAWSTPGGDSS